MQAINVLLVDDDQGDRRLVKMALSAASQSLSFNVDSAGSLAEATEQLREKCYGLVILDLGLPDSSGIETVRKVKQADDQVPIVVLTGLNDEEAGLEAIRNGAADYLVKGQALEYALVRTIRYAMQRKAVEQKQTQLLRQVEDVNRELKDFAHIISHDLKAPLRGIQTLVEWITTDYADKLNDQGKEQLALLNERVERMQSLIEGVLQYSRAGQLKEERQQTDLNELVTEVIDSLAAPENISITLENKLPTLTIESTRVLQVFQNLISNAIKYMDKSDGRIRIGCDGDEGFWRFYVADNGAGIEQSNFENIFKIFQTLGAKDGVESTGVGLTVVRKIVELYGGCIWLESQVGQGSTFYFTLPLQRSQLQESQQEPTEEKVSEPRLKAGAI